MECFTKYCVTREAIRHFRALRRIEGGTKVLHFDGDFGDPLSLYLRALCREGVLVCLFLFALKNGITFPRLSLISLVYSICDNNRIKLHTKTFVL